MGDNKLLKAILFIIINYLMSIHSLILYMRNLGIIPCFGIEAQPPPSPYVCFLFLALAGGSTLRGPILIPLFLTLRGKTNLILTYLMSSSCGALS